MAALEEPLIPTPSNQGFSNFIAGFAALSAANHKREQEQLLMQRLIEKRQADQENFELRNDISRRNIDFKELDLQRKLDLADAAQTHKQDVEAATQGLTAELIRLEPLRGKPGYSEKVADLADRPEYQPAFTSGMGHALLRNAMNMHQSNQRSNQIFYENAVKDAGITTNGRPFVEAIDSTWNKEPDGRVSIMIPDRTGTIKIGEREIPNPDQPNQMLKFPVLAKKVTITQPQLEALRRRKKDLYDQPGVTGATTDTAHAAEWARARAALQSKDPAKVREVYAGKGYDPSELDLDSPP